MQVVALKLHNQDGMIFVQIARFKDDAAANRLKCHQSYCPHPNQIGRCTVSANSHNFSSQSTERRASLTLVPDYA
eukprot:240161-Amphidinium_carterae.1